MFYEVVCHDCKQFQRWEYDVAIGSSIPRFCSACGSRNIEQSKVDSYWYDLAEEMGFEKSKNGADLIRELFRLWNPSEDGGFREFVEGLKEDEEEEEEELVGDE